LADGRRSALRRSPLKLQSILDCLMTWDTPGLVGNANPFHTVIKKYLATIPKRSACEAIKNPSMIYRPGGTRKPLKPA
jgi:hypothetical protein